MCWCIRRFPNRMSRVLLEVANQDSIFWTSIITSNLRHSHADSSRSKYSPFTINNGNMNEWSPIQSVIIRVINKIGRPLSGGPVCLITSMITHQIGRHEVLLPINHNHYNFRENKCIPLFVILSKEIHHNSSIWKIPSLVGSAVVAKVIVINYVIGGLSWVHLIWLADVTVRFQVSDYCQMSDFNPTQ